MLFFRSDNSLCVMPFASDWKCEVSVHACFSLEVTVVCLHFGLVQLIRGFCLIGSMGCQTMESPMLLLKGDKGIARMGWSCTTADRRRGWVLHGPHKIAVVPSIDIRIMVLRDDRCNFFRGQHMDDELGLYTTDVVEVLKKRESRLLRCCV